MRRSLPWVIAFVFAVVSIVFAVLLMQEKQAGQVLAFALSATKTSTPTYTPTATATLTPTLTNTPTIIPSATLDLAATLTQISILARTPTSSQTALPTATRIPVGTRSNPISVGEKLYLVNQDGQQYSYSITKVLRGSDAANYITKLYGSTRDASPGSEFLVATLQIEYDKGSGVLTAGNTSFQALSQERIILIDSLMYTLPGALKSYQKIYEGGRLTADLVFQVDPADTAPLIVYGMKSDGTGGFFFKTQ